MLSVILKNAILMYVEAPLGNRIIIITTIFFLGVPLQWWALMRMSLPCGAHARLECYQTFLRVMLTFEYNAGALPVSDTQP